jgi:hypothetical protein
VHQRRKVLLILSANLMILDCFSLNPLFGTVLCNAEGGRGAPAQQQGLGAAAAAVAAAPAANSGAAALPALPLWLPRSTLLACRPWRLLPLPSLAPWNWGLGLPWLPWQRLCAAAAGCESRTATWPRPGCQPWRLPCAPSPAAAPHGSPTPASACGCWGTATPAGPPPCCTAASSAQWRHRLA